MVEVRNCPYCQTVVVPDTLRNVVKVLECPSCKKHILNICDGECEDCKSLRHCLLILHGGLVTSRCDQFLDRNNPSASEGRGRHLSFDRGAVQSNSCQCHLFAPG